MLNDFYRYWTEMNDGGKKMRFEMEKVFQVSKRMETWHKKDLERRKNATSKSDIGVVLHDSQNKDYNKGLW